MTVTVCAAAGTTWAAGGFPLQNWKLCQLSEEAHIPVFPLSSLPFFHKVFRKFRSLWFLPLCKGVLKLISRFKCWGTRQK